MWTWRATAAPAGAPTSMAGTARSRRGRGANLAAFSADATPRGTTLLTEPLDRESKVERDMHDPDGYLIEVVQATSLLEGRLAAPRRVREARCGMANPWNINQRRRASPR